MHSRVAGGHLPLRRTLRKGAVIGEYARWLAEYRNSSEESVRKHRRYLALFLDGVYGDLQAIRLSGISHDQIEGFFLNYSSTHGVASRQQMQAVLRVFLRFCFAQRYTKRDLSIAVPTIRTYRLAKIPRSVTDKDIQRILDHIDKGSRVGRRDYAMIQMLREYGVRPKQLRTLRLCDIDWAKSEIHFASMKYSKGVCLPLTKAVGDSLLEYLQHGRPPSSRPEVFLATMPPYRPFRRTAPISTTVSDRARAAGIPVGGATPTLFRHAFATRMLRQRQSLKVIADMLGHRRLQTTFMYTKVDFQSLSEVPLEWPEDRP